MEIKRYNCNGRFHEVVAHNGILYLSGQIAPHSVSVTDQTKECLENLKTTLEKYGSDKKHILSATVYLADMGYFSEFNAVWDQWFADGTQPVRTCVEACLADPRFKLEITLVAAIKQ